jgi:lambda family phage portal protein
MRQLQRQVRAVLQDLSPNFLDRAIGYISPQRGIRRLHARAALRVATLAYEGARSGRHQGNWLRPSTSANTEIGASLVNLRNGSRALYRDNPLARKAVDEIVTKIVGTGILPRSKAKLERDRKTLDELFAEWFEQCDSAGRLNFAALEALTVKTMVESGEALIRLRPRLPADNLAVPLQLQILEPDYLDLGKSELTATGYRLQGVEFDKLDRRIGYWLFGQHPGDSLTTASLHDSLTSKFVGAGSILHAYEMERPGQVRGVPRCAPVITAMRDLDEYEEAVRVRKKIEACFAAFVYNADSETNGIGLQATDEDTGEVVETFEPGMIQYLNGNKNIEFADPKSGGAEPDYIRMQQRIIAAGWKIPYEILTGDLSQINYSSYRGGLLGFRDMTTAFRWNTLIPLVCAPIWRRFVGLAYLAGKIETPDAAVEWSEPKFDLLDREKEAAADQAMMRVGTLTWPQAVAAQGEDPEIQLAEIALWNQKFDDNDVVLDSDPRKTSPTGKPQQDNSLPQPAPPPARKA